MANGVFALKILLLMNDDNMSKKIIFIFIIVVIAVIIGIFLKNKKPVNNRTDLVEKQLPVKNLPAELVKNSVIDNLFANTEGYVSEKHEDYFVLKKNNNSIKLYVEEEMNVTNFYRGDAFENNHILYDDIKIGDYLSGGVSIVPNAFSAKEFVNRHTGDIIAHVMVVLQ